MSEIQGEVTMTAHWGYIVQPPEGDAIVVPNEDWEFWHNDSKGLRDDY